MGCAVIAGQLAIYSMQSRIIARRLRVLHGKRKAHIQVFLTTAIAV